ncbi:MAG: hypothetical protein JSR66_11610 [Proteobacteria bacterium]|nr:hypothetical protein [Pseudomonadota bacterium]
MSSENPATNETRRSSTLARVWIAIAVIFGLGALYVALYYWSAANIGHGAAASIPSLLGFVLDELLLVWIILPVALFIVLVIVAVIGWRRTFDTRSRVQGSKHGRLILVGTVFASVCATGLALLKLPSLLNSAFRATICETTTYAEAISPDGRYKAAVIQINCGAMSSSNRQVILTRVPFDSAWESILYFNKQPGVHLAWKKRELTIVGEKSRASLAHSPPDPLLWGGILVRYLGPGDE